MKKYEEDFPKITGGFFKKRQELNRNVTLNAVKERFKGRFDALNCDWKKGEENEPHIYWDSDVAKWLEAASLIILKTNDYDLQKEVKRIIGIIGKNQTEDGYFNSYYLTHKDEKRFTKRNNHELYCAGHLIEAAICYDYATSDHEFLDIVCKYVDLIYKVFYVDKSASFETPGHEEIELALYKLYMYKKDEKYLTLLKFFIDKRGNNNKDTWEDSEPYAKQDHLPLREQKTAEGHAVRACYLYSAMADLGLYLKDEKLISACESIFDDIVKKKQYITGGIGQTANGETFTVPYDMPNITAYQETCASIALCMFARRMDNIKVRGIHSDVIERIIYNSFLSATSLKGDSFFYENPLEIRPYLYEKDRASKTKTRYPIPQRVKLFSCSCCPPNILRFLELLELYISLYKDNTLYIRQYIESEFKNGDYSYNIKTDYPKSGKIKIKVKKVKNIALRIPGYVKKYELTLNKKKMDLKVKDGYIYIPLKEEENIITLEFPLDIRFTEANPKVLHDAGKISVSRGPVVYCSEGVDNPYNLSDVRIDINEKVCLKYSEELSMYILDTKGYIREDKDELYYETENKLKKVKLRLIPYYAFANRGISEMQVWFLKK